MEGSGFRLDLFSQAVSDTLPVRQYNQAKTGSMGSKNGKPVLTEENAEALAQSSGLTPVQVFFLNGLRTFFQLQPAFYRRFYQFTVIPFTTVSESGMSLTNCKVTSNYT